MRFSPHHVTLSIGFFAHVAFDLFAIFGLPALAFAEAPWFIIALGVVLHLGLFAGLAVFSERTHREPDALEAVYKTAYRDGYGAAETAQRTGIRNEMQAVTGRAPSEPPLRNIPVRSMGAGQLSIMLDEERRERENALIDLAEPVAAEHIEEAHRRGSGWGTT